MDRLSEHFLLELFKSSLRSREVLEACREHLKFTYLPNESYKQLWKSITDTFSATRKLPSFGILAQQNETDRGVIELIGKVRDADLPDRELVMQQLEKYVKQAMFVDMYDSLGDVYNSGDKDKAYKILMEASDKINAFSLKANYYEKIFEGYNERFDRRLLSKESDNGADTEKVPFGIDELDRLSKGGINRGDIALFLAQSGVGKSKLLKWIGVNASRLGFKVLHLQAEGTKKECLDLYDATWTGCQLHSIEYGDIDSITNKKIQTAIQNITNQGGEIFVEAFEQFNSASLLDVRSIVESVEKEHGKMDLILMDYLELFNPGNGVKYKPSEERQRREALGDGLKNLAVEFDTRIISCTQASTVSPDLLNDPKFVMTRYNVSEFKGAIKPFSFFVSLNQTDDEKEDNFMRLYIDKMRKYKGGQVIDIYQNYDRERFYDAPRTRREILTQ
jgi:replicative DNA helicase